jgi:hypothetical protein
MQDATEQRMVCDDALISKIELLKLSVFGFIMP